MKLVDAYHNMGEFYYNSDLDENNTKSLEYLDKVIQICEKNKDISE